MQVRVFSASKLHEALALVRQELGPEAVILDRNRKVNGNHETIWQVHAALDTETEPCAKTALSTPESGTKKRLEASMQRLERIITGLGKQETNGLRATLPDAAAQSAFDQLIFLGVSASHAADMAVSFSSRAPVCASLLKWGNKLNPKKRREIVLLIGPGGAGKTTMAAKLATYYSLRGIPAAFVSTDTERMGGLDTLAAYTDVLGVPMIPLRRPDQISKVMAETKPARLVLVDTEGWSSQESGALRRQQKLWKGLPVSRRMLMMPANLDESDGVKLLDAASALNITDIAYSKVDETCMIGKLINWGVASGIPLSYCSYGREASEGIGLLTPRSLTTLLASQCAVRDKELT